MLLLFESMQVSKGSGVLCCQGTFDQLACEAIHVAFDYVRSHTQQIQQALPSTVVQQRDLLAQDVDTLIRCSPQSVVKNGVSCEWMGSTCWWIERGQSADPLICSRCSSAPIRLFSGRGSGTVLCITRLQRSYAARCGRHWAHGP
jgi:hypothetical protein